MVVDDVIAVGALFPPLFEMYRWWQGSRRFAATWRNRSRAGSFLQAFEILKIKSKRVHGYELDHWGGVSETFSLRDI